jgi:hypothetical protein
MKATDVVRQGFEIAQQVRDETIKVEGRPNEWTTYAEIVAETLEQLSHDLGHALRKSGEWDGP